MCSIKGRQKEYIHLLTKKGLVMWKSIGIAIVLMGAMLMNTPVVAEATMEGGGSSPSSGRLKMSGTALPARSGSAQAEAKKQWGNKLKNNGSGRRLEGNEIEEIFFLWPDKIKLLPWKSNLIGGHEERFEGNKIGE